MRGNVQNDEGILGALRSIVEKHKAITIILICILVVSGTIYLQYIYLLGLKKRDIIGIIRVEGYIEDPLSVDKYLDMINQAMLNDSIKAVVLTVDSGGGYADYVEQIYLDLLELKEKKPLVTSVTRALSGGYYLSVAADYIYVHPTSFIGSVGVIGKAPSILIPSETVLETGAYKVTGFSRLLFFHNLSHALDNFVYAVNKSRGNRLKISLTQLKKGMIYLGSEAINAGLADNIGSLQKAISHVAKEAGLREYEVVELKPRESAAYRFSSYSNYTTVGLRNVTLEILDKLHPPPAIHYIYLPPQVINQNYEFKEPSENSPSGRAKVLIDVSHGNRISWWDLEILISELAKRNVTVSFTSSWGDLESKLYNASCLIIASPTKVYTDEECFRIGEFVNRGGFLLIFFDPAWEYIGWQGLQQYIIAPINSLSTRFGFSFAKGYLYNDEKFFGIYRNIYVKEFSTSPLTQNLTSLVFFTATHINSMNKGVAWTFNDTVSSVAEKADRYATMAWIEKGNGTIAAFGDLTFLREPYCYVEDNYRLILNLVLSMTKVKVPVKRVEESISKQVSKPDLPVGTEKNYTEWVDDVESPLRWLKISETEVRVERPNRTTHYYYTKDGALYRRVSDGMECTYEPPLPEPPYPLTKGKKWNYESNYTLTMKGEVYEGRIFGEERVEGFENVKAENGEEYFCAKVRIMETDQLVISGMNMTVVTTGHYWISSEAGMVKYETVAQYYVDGSLAKEESRRLLLKSIVKGKAA